MTELILFDLDGTLTDSAPGITRCVQYALTYLGKPRYEPEELNCFLGPPLKEQFMKFAGLTEEEADTAVEQYRERYNGIGIYENEVYEGIPELLEFLKKHGKKLGVASSKPQVYVEEILRHFGLEKRFDVIVGSELDGTRTDKAEVIEEALRRSGYSGKRSRVIMVGDRSHDVAGAQKCRVACVGAAYGYGGRKELEEAGAELVADTVKDLELLASDIRKGTEETAAVTAEPVKEKKKRVRYGQDLSFGKKIWDVLYPMVFFILCMLVVTVAVMIIVSLATGTQGTDSSQLLTAVPGMPLIISIGFYAVTLLMQRKNYAMDQVRFGAFERRWSGCQIALACVLVVCIGHLWSTAIDLSGLEHVFPGYAESAAGAFEGQNPLLLIAATVLVGPAAEELIFRGMIYRRAENYFRTGWAVGISSALFGIYHGNVIQFLYAAVLGILLAVIYEKSRTLLAPVLAHMAVNLWAIYSGDCIRGLSSLTGGAETIVLIAEAAAAAVCLAALVRGERQRA